MIMHQEAAPEARKQSEEHCRRRMVYEELGLGVKAQSELPAPMTAASVTLDVERHAALIRGSSVEQRARMMVGLQQTYGNACVQRVVQRLSEEKEPPPPNPQGQLEKGADLRSLGYEPLPLGKRSPEVPDLDQGTVDIVKKNIKRKVFRGAISMILVSDEGLRAFTMLEQCVGKTMLYDPNLRDEGMTSAGYLHRSNRMYNITVRIGPSAFGSVAELYSTMKHEALHVQQFLQDPRSSHADQMMSEFVAYAYEIALSIGSGLRQDQKLMKEHGIKLKLSYDRLTQDQQKLNKDCYDDCIQIVRKHIGDPHWEPRL